jgi:hypothetical protein
MSETLGELLQAAVGALPANLKILADRGFLHPVATQERIAQDLYLSYNTYRRHRGRAVAKMNEWPWAGETGHRASTR